MFKKSKFGFCMVVGGIVLPLISAYFRRNPRFCDISGTRKDFEKRATGSCSGGSKTPLAFLTLQNVDIWVFGCCFDICKIVRIRKYFYKFLTCRWFSGKVANFFGQVAKKSFFGAEKIFFPMLIADCIWTRCPSPGSGGPITAVVRKKLTMRRHGSFASAATEKRFLLWQSAFQKI